MDMIRIARLLGDTTITKQQKILAKLLKADDHTIAELRDTPSNETAPDIQIATLCIALIIRNWERCIYAALKAVNAEHLQTQAVNGVREAGKKVVKWD